MSESSGHSRGGPPPSEPIDVHERGATVEGEPQAMDRRLFMQLLVFQIPAGVSILENQGALIAATEAAGIPSVVYADANDPRGVGLLTFSEDPTMFVERVRPLLEDELLRHWVLRPELTMIGRTYASGYERNLEYWLIDKPKQTVLNHEWNWAVWYPLRRSGEFELLDRKEKNRILGEHATIGRAYGEQDLAHDVRLACHGLDAADNEFLIGLIGSNLHRLSHVVQAMRGTAQTAQYIQQMGPFFVGRAIGRHAGVSG